MKVILSDVLSRIEKWLNLLHYHFEIFLLHLMVVRKIPRHVAFIMDGNRRFAREMNLPLPMGHVEGFQMLQRMIRWLFLLRVPEVTVYAFSIENFKRTRSEVSILFSLVRCAISHARRHELEYIKHNVRVRVIGRVNLLPKDIRDAIDEVEIKTRHNDGFRINIAVAYTSRDDIVGGIRGVCEEVQSNLLSPESIDEEDVERSLLTNHCNPVDLLIRTSGETRLSDFLLWEVNFGDSRLMRCCPSCLSTGQPSRCGT
ncbi:dehydrodolichyl diphosphate synthase complex subunit Dhdds-like isoform X2 [Phlebotomus argentipes]|uniref:dehydrodolichyl diphosphate synthase complex subunit Dhdds-like isoform X2 n=1 Tax=Phlebotomus argentipes TaxID=94469 RepID=UPI002893652F|nr:dehydrodolichyl diphosphate synthase complex subunit Dhdds-like isoform X2 [Phlebotomus argentipes]